ncbi:Lar family restriction alleviation protein [Morganella morganii]|uniref:Lar family restriction alleviation protein n=2 Tax=Morganella morganii TaxID=582 RepID=UPI002A28BE6F|nr:Lar family restriction alleviation protein [Morganella morganii]EKU4014371.1 Lar family restriction alleviation protein [Morganella morganii]EMB8446578.1 Lar family restriction alleviation protein [Morganella morganii]
MFGGSLYLPQKENMDGGNADMTEKTQKLKPCPFCGGKNIKSFWFFADTENEKHVRQSAIYCDDCPGQVIAIGFKRDAIAAWNRRAPQCEKE